MQRRPKTEPPITVRLTISRTPEHSAAWSQLWEWLLRPRHDGVNAEGGQGIADRKREGESHVRLRVVLDRVILEGFEGLGS